MSPIKKAMKNPRPPGSDVHLIHRYLYGAVIAEHHHAQTNHRPGCCQCRLVRQPVRWDNRMRDHGDRVTLYIFSCKTNMLVFLRDIEASPK